MYLSLRRCRPLQIVPKAILQNSTRCWSVMLLSPEKTRERQRERERERDCERDEEMNANAQCVRCCCVVTAVWHWWLSVRRLSQNHTFLVKVYCIEVALCVCLFSLLPLSIVCGGWGGGRVLSEYPFPCSAWHLLGSKVDTTVITVPSRCSIYAHRAPSNGSVFVVLLSLLHAMLFVCMLFCFFCGRV